MADHRFNRTQCAIFPIGAVFTKNLVECVEFNFVPHPGAGSMGFNQVIGHVIWMAGREADAFQPRKVVQGPDQPGKCPVSVVSIAVVGVDVLTKQGDFADTLPRELDYLEDNIVQRTDADNNGKVTQAAFVDGSFQREMAELARR